MKRLLILFALVCTACGSPGISADQPTSAPPVVTQIVVVTATPLPATATPKSSPTPAATKTPTPEPTATQRPTETPVPGGKWTSESEESSFDDSQTVTLRLDAENEISGLSGSVLPSLIVRCLERKKEVYVYTGLSPDFESNNIDGATVRIRLDKEEAFTQNTNQSTSGESLFFTDHEATIAALLIHDQMAFEFTPYRSSPAQMTFDLRGLSEIIEPLNEACE